MEEEKNNQEMSDEEFNTMVDAEEEKAKIEAEQQEQKQLEEAQLNEFLERLDNYNDPRQRVQALGQAIQHGVAQARFQETVINYFDGNTTAMEKFRRNPKLMQKAIKEIEKKPVNERLSTKSITDSLDTVIQNLSDDEVKEIFGAEREQGYDKYSSE